MWERMGCDIWEEWSLSERPKRHLLQMNFGEVWEEWGV